MTSGLPGKHNRLLSLFRLGRPVESMLLCGFPCLGSLIAGIASPAAFAGFVVLIWFEAVSVFVFNNWSGADTDRHNPHFKTNALIAGKVQPGLALAFSGGLALVVACGLLLYGLHLFGISVALYATWVLYSHPRTLWKGRPLLTCLSHFWGGLLMFLLGYSWNGRIDAQGFSLAVFFALTFVGGHLNHQIIDHGADAAAGFRTTSASLGPKRTFDLSFGVFTVGYALLALTTLLDLIPGTVALPFLAAAVPHLVLYLLWRRTEIAETSRSYQLAYRLLYLASGSVTALSSALEPRL